MSLEKETATHSSTLAWKIRWTDGGAWQVSVHGVAELDTTERLHFTSVYILGRILTPDSRARVWGETTTFGDEWLEHETRVKRGHEIALLHTVPMTEPGWKYNIAKRGWDQNQSARCIPEGLKRAHTKTLNYAKLTDIEQGEKETPGKFLDRLQEALYKFTDINTKSLREKYS